jgi:hypothetical protein
MIGNAYELNKELVNKELLIFKLYQVNVKDTKAPFKRSVKNFFLLKSPFTTIYLLVNFHFLTLMLVFIFLIRPRKYCLNVFFNGGINMNPCFLY